MGIYQKNVCAKIVLISNLNRNKLKARIKRSEKREREREWRERVL